MWYGLGVIKLVYRISNMNADSHLNYDGLFTLAMCGPLGLGWVGLGGEGRILIMHSHDLRLVQHLLECDM